MNIDPEIVDMVAKFVAVNAVATLVLAVMSYALSAMMLDRLEALDWWLDPSRTPGSRNPPLKHAPIQPPGPTRGNGT